MRVTLRLLVGTVAVAALLAGSAAPFAAVRAQESDSAPILLTPPTLTPVDRGAAG